MTDTGKDKNARKLTLGNTKLSLGGYQKRIAQSASNNGSVVVEVKRGKAATGANLSLNRELTHKVNEEQNERRMAALQKAKSINLEDNDQVQVSSLAKLVEINQPVKSGLELDKVDPKENQVVEPVIPAKNTLIEKKSALVVNKASKEKTEEERIAPTKPRIAEPKKLKKSDIISMLDDDASGQVKTRSLASIKRARAKEKRKNEGNIKAEKIYREVILPEIITVADLANKMSERAVDVTRELMKMGVMAASNQSIDADTAEIVATTLGHSVKRVKESDIEDILLSEPSNPEDMKPRAPIITVMGHVDHGKTSLLDALKSTDVVSREVGGITQHIGAYTVKLLDGKQITFIDTPGHEAFTEMRVRGAQVTDIIVLVVAADDGIKAQTVEAINHAKAAKVPIIVAINKIDKPEADIDRVKTELLSHELVPEDLGGDVITVGVSATKSMNLDKLEEAILLVADVQELQANPNIPANGFVIESRVDQTKGIIATVIIQQGTLKKGNIVLAGNSYGRVRNLCNDRGRTVNEAGPSIAVELYGLGDVPSSGDKFHVVKNDKQARDIVEYRQRKIRDTKVTASKDSLEDMFLKASGESKIKELPIIIKGDVHGSIEAILTSLNKIVSDEVKLKIVHKAVGSITESDIALAIASQAFILGFNVRVNQSAANLVESNKVDIRYYSIIYNLINDVKAIMSGMLSPIIQEEYIGSVVIREVFNISKIGKVAGSYVTKGMIAKGAGVRLLRDNIVIHEGKLKTLKRFKEDVKEVKEGFECGIAFENYSDIKVDDTVEVFKIVEEQKKL